MCNDELSNNVIQGCSLVHKSCLVASGLHGTGDCSSHVDDEVNVKFKLGGGGEWWVFGCGLKGLLLLLCLLFFLEVSLIRVLGWGENPSTQSCHCENTPKPLDLDSFGKALSRGDLWRINPHSNEKI